MTGAVQQVSVPYERASDWVLGIDIDSSRSLVERVFFLLSRESRERVHVTDTLISNFGV